MATSSRRKPRRRVWPTIRLLLLVGVLAAGGTALYPLYKKANPDPTDLKVRYRTDTPATAATAKPWLEVFNTSDKPVKLADVRLRYHFSADDAASGYSFNCIQAVVGCSNISGRIRESGSSDDTADHVLELAFTEAAGSLRPGENSKGIELQLYRVDQKKMQQSNDRSFDADKTSFKESEQVTAHLKGDLAWGKEPEGISKAPDDAEAAPEMAPQTPSGVLFDDFNYRGPKDRALFKHGWLVRTSKGGPGIENTWTPGNVSFPAGPADTGGQAIQLRASTDGTKAGTKQSSVGTLKQKFRTGTYAARVRFSDKPTTGRNGDHVNQSFYTLGGKGDAYSELDNEYMPNGGWGAPGPKLDTTSWRHADKGDRVTSKVERSLAGWRTMTMTVTDSSVTYRVDGRKVYVNGKAYAPRSDMSIHLNTWFVDLPFQGERAWDMQVDWMYFNGKAGLSAKDVETQVKNLADGGMHYLDTVK